MKCPKCGSEDIQTQIVSGQTNPQSIKKKHGIIWRIFIGWWYVPIKRILLGAWILVWRLYKKLSKKAESTNFIKSVHVCTNCGHGWSTEIE